MVQPMRTIAAGWDEFVANMYPEGMTPAQRDQLRRAYHCGAFALFGELMRFVFQNTDPEAMRRNADAVRVEFLAFCAEEDPADVPPVR